MAGENLHFHWVAEYEDGTSIYQYDKEGKPVKLDSLDKSRLKYFALVPRSSGLSKYIVELDPSRDLIYFRRNIGNLKDGIQKVLYFIGWRKKTGLGEKEVKSEICINPETGVTICRN